MIQLEDILFLNALSNEEYNSALKQEGVMKSILGMTLALPFGGPVAWAGYRIVRAAMQEKSARCGVLSIGLKRDVCFLEVKKMGAEQTIAFLNKQRGSCKQNKNPEKCAKKIDDQIIKFNQVMANVDAKLKSLALKGKDVGAGIDRARRGTLRPT